MRWTARVRSPIFALNRAIGLSEGFKDCLVFIRRDADTGVRDAERDVPETCITHLEGDLAAVSAFQGLGQQVPQNLRQTARIGLQLATRLLERLDRKTALRLQQVFVVAFQQPFLLGQLCVGLFDFSLLRLELRL